MKYLVLTLFMTMSSLIASNSFAETWDTTCSKNDCFTNGWVTYGNVNNFHLQATCKNDNCARNGWTSIDNHGTQIDVSCKSENCFTVGWRSVENRLNGDVFIDEASCNKKDCHVYGWQVTSSYDKGGQVHCKNNNCSGLGGASFWRSRRSITKCKASDCYSKGWKVYFLDPAVPPTF